MLVELQDFHFIRPMWLLAIVPLLLLVMGLKYIQKQQSGWQGVIASHLYQHLISVKGGKTQRPPLFLLGFGWVLASIALAGPTWERLPQPVYQLHTGKVVVMDMSMSMRATDITPNRLSRAKFKAIDLVKQAGEGEIGLIAYAGDAFVISPLSSDIQNLTALIPSLAPEIMPTPGSEPQYAMEEAIKLLDSAGYKKGEIFWITDGVDITQVAPITQMIAKHDYRLSILGIGTEEGAPIKLPNNELMKDSRGAIVIPQFESSPLKLLARKGKGRYIDMQPTDQDIEYLIEQELMERNVEQNEGSEGNFGDQWKEMGPYLILFILPFAAYAFRRGILAVLLCVMLPLAPPQAKADWWSDLWQRPDQQGMQSFNKENYADASAQFDDPMWKGSAAYRNGDYEQAIEAFSQLDTAESNYNLGNALAKAGDLEQAIEAYKKALQQDPNHEDAKINKELLEQMQQQQEQQNQQDQQNQDNQEQQDKQEQSQNQDQSDSSQQQQDQEQQDQQQSDSENSDQQNSDQQQEQDQQNQSEQEKEQQEQQEQKSEQEQSEQEESEKEQEQQAEMQQEELTDEQKEQQQKMQTLLRKVPDDPAYLLKRKMLLEQERRKRQRLPSQATRNW
ncbi:VWA domain-containing protein [Paraneptunicella aestuarii]|uniref:vWA domain-containing protein n=1 Tax=Paraneptunicella aestuarii TaxID=2831148 RepID=UPI001E29F2E7|nr:VWA domain-containing protein [Paraneptunicella aestuarii]UAA40104.1 VWA domain-containing protein [Paraneptunicella aestuarii]